MGTACDACRLRKVKCRFDEEAGGGCAFCTSIGIPCTTAPRQRHRTKAGRKSASASTSTAESRASASFADAFAGALRPAPRFAPTSTSASASASASTSNPNANPQPDLLSSLPPRAPSPPPDDEDEENAQLRDTSLSHIPRGRRTNKRARLLGVPGLTRAALDSCIESFFATIGHIIRLSEPQDVFWRRARVRLYYSAGLDVPAELADVAQNPATELLVLSVACRGAPYAHPELAEPIYKRCCELVLVPENLAQNGLDAIEALLLLSELSVRTRLAKLPGHGSKTAPVTLDPLGKGAVIDLVFYHGLHVPPPQHAPDFTRRLVLHATAWVHDAIRSASAQTMCRITEDMPAWPMPVNGDDFAYVPLTMVTRQLCSTLLSNRAKGIGIQTKDVHTAIAAIASLKQRTRISVEQLTALVEPSRDPSTALPRDGARSISLTEYVWLLSTHYWLYVVMWVAVQEDVDRHPGNLSLGTVADAKSATTAACEDMARLAELCTEHKLHVWASRGVRNHFAAFTLFLLRDFASIATPTVAQSCQYYELAERLNRGVRSACFFPDSEKLADTLLMMLHRGLRVEIRDAARVAERGLDALATVSSQAKARQLDGPPAQAALMDAPLESSFSQHDSTSPPFPTMETSPNDQSQRRTSTSTYLQPQTESIPPPTASTSYTSSPWTPVSGSNLPGGTQGAPPGVSPPISNNTASGPSASASTVPIPPPHIPQPAPGLSFQPPGIPTGLHDPATDMDWLTLMHTLMECGVELPMPEAP